MGTTRTRMRRIKKIAQKWAIKITYKRCLKIKIAWEATVWEIQILKDIKKITKKNNTVYKVGDMSLLSSIILIDIQILVRDQLRK